MSVKLHYLSPMWILSSLSSVSKAGPHVTDFLHTSQRTPFNWFLEQTTTWVYNRQIQQQSVKGSWSNQGSKCLYWYRCITGNYLRPKRYIADLSVSVFEELIGRSFRSISSNKFGPYWHCPFCNGDGSGKVIQNPYLGLDHHWKLASSSGL